MNPTIIDGRAVSAAVRESIKTETAEFIKTTGTAPGLAVVLVGDNPASQVYVRNKHRACEEVGFLSRVYTLPAETTEEELLALLHELNLDDEIHGILVQLPLPKHISEKAVILAIDPRKDVDAFHPQNVGGIMTGDYSFVPCTPAGVMELLSHYGIDPAGKHCVIVGRSNIVGKPQALLMLEKNATVTVCHSRTPDLSSFTRAADILVVAVGRAALITADMVKEGAVVVDVGMNRNAEGKLCGDVDFEGVSKVASYITPVPGGVGPMTITMLLRNTMTAAKKFFAGK
ncbi:MAG: bifunctional methylenetetrahydrofolate dehydrogenase/methenyltetrahydrofolate cyclohydrolase FolD [Clostridia bacterium]|nr:bifunctional methylenetetrahydrofolate dehydrogenase/methenyltetrahydrofolate cyclohydrolase FolD [Clostridia bacterium]